MSLWVSASLLTQLIFQIICWPCGSWVEQCIVSVNIMRCTYLSFTHFTIFYWCISDRMLVTVKRDMRRLSEVPCIMPLSDTFIFYHMYAIYVQWCLFCMHITCSITWRKFMVSVIALHYHKQSISVLKNVTNSHKMDTKMCER